MITLSTDPFYTQITSTNIRDDINLSHHRFGDILWGELMPVAVVVIILMVISDRNGHDKIYLS